MGNYKIRDVAGLIKIAERNNHSYYFFPYAIWRLTSLLILLVLFFFGFIYYFLKDFEMNLELALYIFVSTIFSLGLFFLSFYSVTILDGNTVVRIHSLLRNKQIPIENIRNIWRYTKTEHTWSTYHWKETNTTFYLHLNNDKKIKLYCIKNYNSTMQTQPLLNKFDTLMNDLSNDLGLEVISKTKNNR